MSQFSPSRFENLNVYDSPGVVFSTLMDGEFTSEGALAAFFDPSKTTPKERDTVLTRLKKASGDNRVAGALIDVALNPWVWMFAVTSPAGVEALANGAKSIFTSKAAYLATIAKEATMLQAIGLSPPIQTLQGTSAAAAAAQARAGYQNFLGRTAAGYEKSMGEFLAAHDLPNLDPRKIINPPKKAKAEYFQRLLTHSLQGLDKERTLQGSIVKSKYYEIGDGGVKTQVSFKKWEGLDTAARDHSFELLDTEAKVGAYIGNGALEQAIREVPGLGKVRDEIRKSFTEEARILFGRQEGSGWVSDENKLASIWDFMGNDLFNGHVAKDAAVGIDLAHKLMGPEVASLMEQGLLSKDNFVSMMKRVSSRIVQGDTYFPRNVTETVMPNGKSMGLEDFMEFQQTRAFKMPVQAINRVRADEYMHPDDYQWIADNFKGDTTEHFAKASARATSAKDKAAALGRNVTFQRVRATEALGKHFHASAETYAYALQAPNDEVKAAITQMLEERAAAGGTHVRIGHETMRRNVTNVGVPVSIEENLGGVSGDRAPLGGYNLADVMYQAHGLMPGKYQRDTLVHLLIPGSTGRIRVNHALGRASVLNAKLSAGAFADSMLGTGIEKLGGPGERVIQGMRNYASAPIEKEVGSTLGRGATKLLYASHLGMNMSSVVMNGMQPWLMGANWLGVGPILHGYKEGFRELSNYMGDRVKTYGAKALSAEEQSLLARRNFKHADWDGEDFTGVTRGTEEVMDALSFQPEQGRFSRNRSAFFEMMMAPFQKVEWLNRSVIAHAVEELHRQKGTTSIGIIKGDVRRAVAETQFGMDFVNTPAAFQTDNPALAKLGGVGTIPFMRQFTHYPIRSLTALLNVAPAIGRGERTFGLTGLKTSNRFGVMAHDILRGMAISAVGYEVGKNLLHADISRGLFAASVGQLPQQFVEGEQGILPAPPAVDIVRNIGKFIETGDLELARQTVPRLIPGGLAISRAMSLAPQLPTWASVAVGQKTYADWKNVTPDGRVPIYKADGTLVDYSPVTPLLAKSVGFDLGAAQETTKIDRMLVSNSEELRDYRREYINRLMQGDSFGAEKVAKTVEKRFDVPLTVTKSQIKAAQKLRNTPRSERVVDKLPAEVRPQYMKLIAQQPSRFNVSAQALLEQTSKQRDASRVGVDKLDPAVMAEIDRKLKAMNPIQNATRSDSAFGTFGDFE